PACAEYYRPSRRPPRPTGGATDPRFSGRIQSMKIRYSQRSQGIALIIVLMVIAILAVLAGNFAATMKVETMLARNSSFDSELEWLGRAGVEAAKAVLAQEKDNFSALNQTWAGGR